MQLTEQIHAYLDAHQQEAYELLLELAQIPAPSHHEQLRAEFCRNWLHNQGASGAYIDEALNVICPVGVTDENPLVVFMAHTDVVFPDREPLPLRVADGRIHCPGVGDDTANLVALLMAAKFITQEGLLPKEVGVLLVANSCEEGLGNLKGSRAILEKFGSRLKEFVTFDGTAAGVVHKAVGSVRYRICVDTQGGHSYGKFGNPNAIALLASVIDALYAVQVPEKGKTTYNVGTISGGTSVNTIAQHAEMLYEYRSDAREDLQIMGQHLERILNSFREKGVSLTVEVLGERPCGGDVDPAAHQALLNRAAETVTENYGFVPTFRSGSTDCNVALAMGIPAVCVGCVMGVGAHTREEYVEIDSLRPGLGVAFGMILTHF